MASERELDMEHTSAGRPTLKSFDNYSRVFQRFAKPSAYLRSTFKTSWPFTRTSHASDWSKALDEPVPLAIQHAPEVTNQYKYLRPGRSNISRSSLGTHDESCLNYIIYQAQNSGWPQGLEFQFLYGVRR